jgi:excinuclease ABC subunit C
VRAIPDRVASRLPHLPETPGVYLWKDAGGTVLYVGKAKRLRSRARSYFASDHESVKTRALVRLIDDLDTIVVPDEAHALILENTLIKEYRPRFNVSLRDDKSYPYIKVTVQEPFPRVLVTRRWTDDGARFFGPYTDVGAMRRALNVVKRIFTVRSCQYALPEDAPDRPCLDYHIGRCLAPCVGLQSRDSYRAMIDEVVLFLEGRTDEVVRRVAERMHAASSAMEYERAAGLRDALRHLERMEEPTVVLRVEGGDQDVVGMARDGDDACAVVLRVRGGRLVGRDQRFLEHVEGESDGAILTAFLAGRYATAAERAAELLVPLDFDDRSLLEASLATTTIRVPQRGPRRELVDLAQQNARHLLEEFKLASSEADERATNPVYELQRELGLTRLPRSLVCFDVSTAQGTDTVASCVWFENARPRRAEYRKFKVKTVEGSDDFASIREVVGRYFRRRLDEQKPLPDLVVVDGGRGQLSAAAAALSELGLADLPLASLAKRDEEVFTPGRTESLRIPRRSPALRLLQQARDEAHRVAVSFNRARRTARTVTSRLLELPGVGPRKRRVLLNAFGSLEGVRAAAPEAIAELPGFSLASARRLIEGLREPGSAASPPADAPADASGVDGADPAPNDNPATS